MTIIWNEDPLRTWTPEKSAECQRLRDSGLTPKEIARAIGRTEAAVTSRLAWLSRSPEKRRASNANRKRQPTIETSRPLTMENAASYRPTPEMLADRARREAMPYRDLTSVLMGDPPLGLSALDGRQH